ncbi:MAG: hypothetical protein UW63_C0061G0002 [Candidatus Uhrbacteria bacterium GW2011_GWF2_44_350]|uniref:Uncharacterized protein n=1 Tax=Candidatus Uhrbacteria bacterium GW2011_GWF2_44_350 TaxID=1619000 RepID=A0A0G1JD52_9BACT|nr:MAG: hypothetical protein UW63_C0061G0002 [Candidatus Uhrbacteria bacterium GW2011_GWF2_44_350]HBR80611.1 hypothetical protein [Candidatus Uhrbacteria bacterium]HCU31727.1 hypothetical protein [Candidatus Uhrbacteria bacterium]
MNKIQLFIALAVVLNLAFPKPILANSQIFYADSVYGVGNQTYQSNHALGEPDGLKADFFNQNTYITLSFGEGVETTGDLTIYFNIFNYGAGYRVEFLDSNLVETQTSSAIFPLATTEITIDYTGEIPYGYVTITSIENETWSLDAVMTTVTEEAVPETTDEPEEIPVLISEETCNGNQGLVIKRIDDDNLTANANTTVYVVGCDGTSHVFPNELTYQTWWPDFESLSFVESSFLAQHGLGNNVTVRPGTYLVKLATDPKVYAVEPGGILRWIPNEATAQALYGNNWNQIVIDISDELFADYTIGEDLTDTIYPEAVIGFLPVEGRVVYLSNSSYYNLPGDTINSLRLNTKFLVPLSAEIMTTYSDGGDLIYDEAIAFPF